VTGDTAQWGIDAQALHCLKDRPDTTLKLWTTYETEKRLIGGEWKVARHGVLYEIRDEQRALVVNATIEALVAGWQANAG
jgi:hypothetical protein